MTECLRSLEDTMRKTMKNPPEDRQLAQVSGVRCQVSGVRCQVSGVRCQVSGVRCQVSGVRCQVFTFSRPWSCRFISVFQWSYSSMSWVWMSFRVPSLSTEPSFMAMICSHGDTS
ncbi:hypothetical protein EYF80_043570 [Liparis tanakae]|uniref:Uncharacterized protein n=1 Tax=Liparis tanakae TaxID=230148 RepID=A0A4Z2FZA3_9TELE|nr:hypothetical protein EYF80_043570 [Liparis tanakae]